jgi:hypothetical protein
VSSPPSCVNFPAGMSVNRSSMCCWAAAVLDAAGDRKEAVLFDGALVPDREIRSQAEPGQVHRSHVGWENLHSCTRPRDRKPLARPSYDHDSQREGLVSTSEVSRWATPRDPRLGMSPPRPHQLTPAWFLVAAPPALLAPLARGTWPRPRPRPRWRPPPRTARRPPRSERVRQGSQGEPRPGPATAQEPHPPHRPSPGLVRRWCAPRHRKRRRPRPAGFPREVAAF